MSSETYERVGLVKPEVFVYRIPPLGTNRGYRAAEWKLDAPDWTGRLRLVALGPKLEIRLEDKTSGELFAKAPIDKYPGPAIEAVTDSSRYFVIRLLNDNGQSANIGIGFADRGDSFDLNVALQDHFKYLTAEAEREKLAKEEAGKPKLDLGFKEGQTITISLGKSKEGETRRPRPTTSGAGGGGPVPLLPPPPSGSSRIAPPPSRAFPNPPSATNLPAQDKPSSSSFADEFASLSTEPPKAKATSGAGGSGLDDLLGL